MKFSQNNSTDAWSKGTMTYRMFGNPGKGEMIDRACKFILCDNSEILVDPASIESLLNARQLIDEAVIRMSGPDGRVMFAAAQHQLDDVEATLTPLLQGSNNPFDIFLAIDPEVETRFHRPCIVVVDDTDISELDPTKNTIFVALRGF